MPTKEKFSVRWTEFHDKVSNTFTTLRKDSDFTDVTLACEDGQQIEAHKVIISASSPFFHNILTQNKHAHPLIYMRGMKLDDLLAILDFLYYGEANIYHDNLNSFLNIAEELQLQGLNGGEGWEQGENVENPTNQAVEPIVPSNSTQSEDYISETSKALENHTKALDNHTKALQNMASFSESYSEDEIIINESDASPRHEIGGKSNEPKLKRLEEENGFEELGWAGNITNPQNVGVPGRYASLETTLASQKPTFFTHSYKNHQTPFCEAVATLKYEFFPNFKVLDKQIRSMISLGGNIIRRDSKHSETSCVCQVCGKEGLKQNIKEHIEGKHIEGISIPCNICGKILR